MFIGNINIGIKAYLILTNILGVLDFALLSNVWLFFPEKRRYAFFIVGRYRNIYTCNFDFEITFLN